MKSRMLGLLFLVLSLTGCTSLSELRSQEAIFIGSSDKRPDVLAGCIADNLELRGMGRNVQTRPTTKGYAVIRVDYGTDYGFIIEIESNRASDVVAYSALPSARGNLLIVAAIRYCLK